MVVVHLALHPRMPETWGPLATFPYPMTLKWCLKQARFTSLYKNHLSMRAQEAKATNNNSQKKRRKISKQRWNCVHHVQIGFHQELIIQNLASKTSPGSSCCRQVLGSHPIKGLVHFKSRGRKEAASAKEVKPQAKRASRRELAQLTAKTERFQRTRSTLYSLINWLKPSHSSIY